MGIFVNLEIMPDEISQEEWEGVYNETLALIEAYPFMDRIFDSEKYGIDWVYVDNTKERELKLDNTYQTGWHTFGDILTMQSAESFILVKNIDYYKTAGKSVKNNRKDNYKDILFSQIKRNTNVREYIPNIDTQLVFESKTQVYPFHIYILAIACLIESRFPRFAIVYGDISKGQMKKAISWANSILKKPINITDRTDNEKLLQRLKKILKDESDILEAFMELSMNKRDVEFGKFIRDNFTYKAIVKYYTGIFKQCPVNTIGFKDILTEFFDQGYTLDMACDILVLNEDGCKLPPSEFTKAVLPLLPAQQDTYTNNKNNNSNENDNCGGNDNGHDFEDPDTIESLFAKTLLKLIDFKNPLIRNISFKSAGKYKVDSQYKVDLQCEADSQHEADTQYDIEDIELLILWKPGDTVAPYIESALKAIKTFADKLLEDDAETFGYYNALSNIEKIKLLIWHNRYFYIRKKAWDHIFCSIQDANVFNRILSVMFIQADEVNINRICRALINNMELFNKYIL